MENVTVEHSAEVEKQMSVAPEASNPDTTDSQNSAKIRKMTDYELDQYAYDFADDLSEYEEGRKVFLADICTRFNCAKNVAEAIYRRANHMVPRYFNLDVESGFGNGTLKHPSYYKRGIMIGANHIKQINNSAPDQFQIKQGDEFSVTMDDSGKLILTQIKEETNG